MKLDYLISKLLKKSRIPAIKDSEIHSNARVCSGAHVYNSKVGKYSYVGNDATVIHSEIGAFCSIADNVIVGGASHPVDWVSTSPVFHQGRNILGKNYAENGYNPYTQTNIGNDVWIGNNSLIKSGVVISTGAVIGMGSVVTKNVGPYEIWAGNPAVLIRKRFTDEKIEKLLLLKWWDFEEAELSKLGKSFNDVDLFIEYFKEEGM